MASQWRRILLGVVFSKIALVLITAFYGSKFNLNGGNTAPAQLEDDLSAEDGLALVQKKLHLHAGSHSEHVSKSENNANTDLDTNQKAYVDGQPVLGDGVGHEALNQCSAFPQHLVNDPHKPDVKVCGTGIKMTAFVAVECGQGRKEWEVGACDASKDPTTCRTIGPSEDAQFGTAQSYKIEQC